MRNTVSIRCHQCNRSFLVLEDEQNDHHCPICGTAEAERYGNDVMGDELKKGDYYLEHNGEIILETNVIDYLVDFLGAERKTAGED